MCFIKRNHNWCRKESITFGPRHLRTRPLNNQGGVASLDVLFIVVSHSSTERISILINHD